MDGAVGQLHGRRTWSLDGRGKHARLLASTSTLAARPTIVTRYARAGWRGRCRWRETGNRCGGEWEKKEENVTATGGSAWRVYIDCSGGAGNFEALRQSDAVTSGNKNVARFSRPWARIRSRAACGPRMEESGMRSNFYIAKRPRESRTNESLLPWTPTAGIGAWWRHEQPAHVAWRAHSDN